MHRMVPSRMSLALVFALVFVTPGCSSVLGSFPEKPLPDDERADAAASLGGDASMIPPPLPCPSTCAADTAAPCALACEQDLPGPIAVGAAVVAWTARTSSGTVLRAVDRAGGATRSLATLAAPASALALAGTRPVWIDGASVSTVRQGQVVVLAQQPATGLAAIGDRAFWSVATTGTIQGCTVDACAPQPIHVGQVGVTALGAGVVSGSDVRGAWLAAGASPRELRGGGLEPMTAAATLAKDDALADALAVDPADGAQVIGVLQAMGSAELVRHPGGEVLAKVTGTVRSLAASAGAVFAAVTDGTKTRVMSLEAGGTRSVVADDVDADASVAADELYVYWTVRAPEGGRVMRAKR